MEIGNHEESIYYFKECLKLISDKIPMAHLGHCIQLAITITLKMT